MKIKSASQIAALVVILLFQISTIYAQVDEVRQQCVTKSSDEFCIEINASKYKGYYQILDPDDLSTKKVFYQNNETVKFKANVPYILVIGNEGNNIVVTATNEGKITSSNNIAINVKTAKKIQFNTVETFIEPNNYTGYYYLSIFYAQDIFYNRKDNWCPFAKDLPASDQVQTVLNCPVNRTSRDAVDLVPSLTYFVEPHTKGYDGAISFKIDNLGDVIKLDHNRAAEIVERGDKKILRLKNKAIRITTTDYTGKLWIGVKKFDISPDNPVTFTIIPYSPTYLVLQIDSSEKLLLTTNYQAIPNKMTLQAPSQTNGNFEICIVGLRGCQ